MFPLWLQEMASPCPAGKRVVEMMGPWGEASKLLCARKSTAPLAPSSFISLGQRAGSNTTISGLYNVSTYILNIKLIHSQMNKILVNSHHSFLCSREARKSSPLCWWGGSAKIQDKKGQWTGGKRVLSSWTGVIFSLFPNPYCLSHKS